MGFTRLLPMLFAVGLAALSFAPRVHENPWLTWSFWGAAASIVVVYAALALWLGDRWKTRTVRVILKPQHYVQALVQISVLAYWGWFWRPVYGFALLIVAQLLFAYAVEMLISWAQHDEYRFGFGPFPIVLSISLFLWFRDDWFYLQFLMIAVGFLGKRFIRWKREEKWVHVFNPSAFTLGLFSLALIATNTTSLTWGPEIASTLTLAPWIYAFLFGTGLVVMYFFSITLVAASAAVMLFLLSGLYFAATGVPYFLDSEIPAAVFLGLHLLITDPSTSPRTPPGKLIFGALYGVGVFLLYSVLTAAGTPTFYDKLLCVPLLNLSVRAIDGFVQTAREGNSGLWRLSDWISSRPNLGNMAAWILFFAAMTGLGKTDGPHTGDRLPFWEGACEQDRRNACERLLQLEATYCADNSAWACNELGRHHRTAQLANTDPERATRYFARACELRFQPACLNLLESDASYAAAPRMLDLRLLLREGGRNLMRLSESELVARACDHGFDGFACDGGTRLP